MRLLANVLLALAGVLAASESRIVSQSPWGVRSTDWFEVSDDGLRIAFVDGEEVRDENGILIAGHELWLRDVRSAAAVRLTGGEGQPQRPRFPALSGDARWLAYEGDIDGAQRLILVETATGAQRTISRRGDGAPTIGWLPAIAGDGSVVAFAGPHNLLEDGAPDLSHDGLFLYDRATDRVTRLLEVATEIIGTAISGDGRVVAFVVTSVNAPGWVPVLRVHDRASGGDELVARDAHAPSLDASGRRVAFQSAGSLLAEDDDGAPDAYVLDRSTRALRLASRRADGRPISGSVALKPGAALSADGGRLAFVTTSDGVVAGDDNGRSDAFIADLGDGGLTRVSLHEDGSQPTIGVASVALARTAGTAVFLVGAEGLGDPPSEDEDWPGAALVRSEVDDDDPQGGGATGGGGGGGGGGAVSTGGGGGGGGCGNGAGGALIAAAGMALLLARRAR